MTIVISAWSARPFRKVWGAGALSGLGAEIGELALPALALITLGATAVEASWVRAALLAPFLLLTLWLGVVVDRSSRRPLMIVADLVRGALLIALCTFAVLGWLTIPILVVVAATLGSMTVLFQLANFSFLPDIVSEHQLIDANAKITATDSAISVAGSGVGGVLVQLLTAPLALAVNAIGYLGSAVLIGRVRVTEPRSSIHERHSAFAEAKEGLWVLARHRILRALVAEASAWNFGNEIFILALTVYILKEIPAGPLILGLIVTCGGVGAFLGSMLSATLTARFGYGKALVASLILGNTAPIIGALGAWLHPSGLLVPLSAAFLLSGIGIGVANSQSTSIRQIAVAPELRGRVNGGYRLLSWGALSVGALLGGVLITTVGIWPAALAGSAVMALATLPVALSPARRVRAIDDVKQPRPGPR